MALEGRWAFGRGPQPARVLFVLERPGKAEASMKKALVGPSCDEHLMYLRRAGIYGDRHFRITNLVLSYRDKNPDPTQEEIEQFARLLDNEIKDTQPEILVTVGRISTRRFLGEYYAHEKLSIEMVHGMPHECGCFDPDAEIKIGQSILKRKDLSHGAIIFPLMHPAGGLHQPRQKPMIGLGYENLAKYLRGELFGAIESDIYKDKETYKFATGHELSELIGSDSISKVIGLDTEGYESDPWSLQLTSKIGKGYTLRVEEKDFDAGKSAFVGSLKSNPLVVMHNAIHDMKVCDAMGIDLSRCRIYDTMYAAYLIRRIRRSLQICSYRLCGRAYSDEFKHLTQASAREKQLRYLEKAMTYAECGMWPNPEPRMVIDNKGAEKEYGPKGALHKLKGILRDLEKDDSLDLKKRFYRPPGNEEHHRDVGREIVIGIEETLGPFPKPSLGDINPRTAEVYASRDPDLTLRVKSAIDPILKEMDLIDLMNRGMRTLPAFYEIEKTGMPASRSRFMDLKSQFREKSEALRSEISERFYGGRPFNPRSDDQVIEILRQRGLSPLKKTKKTKKWSVAADSIEHYKYTDDFVDLLFRAKHLMHLISSFCNPVLEGLRGQDGDIGWIRSNLRYTSTTSRRLSTSAELGSSKLNILAIPSRTKEGLLIRTGFVAPDGYIFVSADLSKIEPRVLAHLSQDPFLMQVFHEDRNLYCEIGAQLMGISVGEVKENKNAEYSAAKETTLGTTYGMGGKKLQEQLWALGVRNWDLEKCEYFLDEFWNICAGAKKWKGIEIAKATDLGYVRDASGMYRFLPDLDSGNKYARAEAERHVVSHLVQTLAQSMIQESMAWLMPQLWRLRDGGIDARLALQVHDELMVLCPESERVVETVSQLLIEALENHHGFKMTVPIKAESAVGRSWGDLKG